jgi:hypothetical protein
MMHTALGGQFRQRQVTPVRLQRYLRLEPQASAAKSAL